MKELVPPAVYLVHGKIGNSASAIICDTSDGKFGPFAKQLFIADQSHSNLSRVFLETINGIKQGVVFPFRGGFQSGLIGGRMDEEGRVFVGGSDRGWGARGGKPYCFEKCEWTGKTPFEIETMTANVIAYRCVQIIADDISSLPFRAGPDPTKPMEFNPAAPLDVIEWTLDKIDLVVHAGEIVGIAGVEGNGQTSLRERLFHGVRALRLNPVHGGDMYGRDGMLAHTYMLGPKGDSNGCVSFKDYERFLRAYLNGEVKRLIVVQRQA